MDNNLEKSDICRMFGLDNTFPENCDNQIRIKVPGDSIGEYDLVELDIADEGDGIYIIDISRSSFKDGQRSRSSMGEEVMYNSEDETFSKEGEDAEDLMENLAAISEGIN